MQTITIAQVLEAAATEIAIHRARTDWTPPVEVILELTGELLRVAGCGGEERDEVIARLRAREPIPPAP